jgi:hypothetical protein
MDFFIYFKPRIYPTGDPLSCFFVSFGLLQNIEIGAPNIDPARRRLEGFPEKKKPW